MSNPEPCIVCGLDRDDHHEYVGPKRASSSCKCDAGTWGDPQNIPAVCGHYNGDAEEYCANCEHDRACHA